uniref:Uncharacterized protein n=1 Tax=Rhizophora mucronata TaxID=61149 RepID=A0A2P2NVT7_RHIMU
MLHLHCLQNHVTKYHFCIVIPSV